MNTHAHVSTQAQTCEYARIHSRMQTQACIRVHTHNTHIHTRRRSALVLSAAAAAAATAAAGGPLTSSQVCDSG